jgi:beta-glucosidase-like glycosyl hydrolase
MSHNNAVNDIPGCASDFLLKETLRKEWKFKASKNCPGNNLIL